MSDLILASRSSARARLLAEAGIAFVVDAAAVDEEALKVQVLCTRRNSAETAQDLAVAKALEVSRRRDGLVIGADQTLELDGVLFDKPASLEAARAQLQALRGREHSLHAAAALAQGGVELWRTVGSVRLRMRTFTDAFLGAYLEAEGEVLLGCVGAYRLEARGVQLFDQIEGDYFTVLGLPLLPLLAALRLNGHVAS